MKRKSWNNESRKRRTAKGKPEDRVPFHMTFRRDEREEFEAAVAADPRWRDLGAGPVVRELVRAWLKGRVTV